MTINTLSLPIDIPWKRLCVSDDMIDENVCDREFPYRWRSSIAIFSYEPPEEHQTYDDMIVSYLKVACTITGLQPGDEIRRELGIAPGGKVNPFNDPDVTELEIDSLNKYYGCYGAILEVSLKPLGSAADDKSKYPYFMDFEPKKRELYELVSETGEVMSRSLSDLNVQKGATTTQSHEVLDVFKGASAEVGVAKVGVGGSVQGEWGTRDVTQHEYSNQRSTDQSREMRELFSHTTQLTQMYHQFTSYHLGTNRAVFFMLPRPHIVQTDNTFVNGPRKLEGIQEVFLVVMRPKDVQEFRVEAYLETAHLALEENPANVQVYPLTVSDTTRHPLSCDHSETRDFLLDDTRLITLGIKEDPAIISPDPIMPAELTHIILEKSESFPIPQGWQLDTSQGDVGYKLQVKSDGLLHFSDGRATEVTNAHIIVSARLGIALVEGAPYRKKYLTPRPFMPGGPQDCGESRRYLTFGELTVTLTMHLRTVEGESKDVATTLFLTGRGVCCPPEEIKEDVTPVLVEMRMVQLADYRTDESNSMTIKQANKFRDEIGAAMIQSINDPHRYPRGTVSMLETQFLSRRIAQWINQPGHPDNQSVQEIDGLKSDVRDKIVAAMPRLRRADLLRMKLQETRDRFELTHEESVHLRRAALGLEQKPADPKDRWDPPSRRKEHVIPNVLGFQLAVATRMLQAEDLLVGEVGYQDSEQPRDIVLSQRPESGKRARGGTEIQLVLATGLTARIPDVIDRSLTEALLMLREAGLQSEPELEFVKDQKKPKHQVLRVTPAPRTYVTPHVRVVLQVSSGN
jgi:hypothetical protein